MYYCVKERVIRTAKLEIKGWNLYCFLNLKFHLLRFCKVKLKGFKSLKELFDALRGIHHVSLWKINKHYIRHFINLYSLVIIHFYVPHLQVMALTAEPPLVSINQTIVLVRPKTFLVEGRATQHTHQANTIDREPLGTLQAAVGVQAAPGV